MYDLLGRREESLGEMLGDPIKAGNLAVMFRGKTFGMGFKLLIALLFLLMVGLILWIRLPGLKADFQAHEPAFFRSLLTETGPTVQVHRLDVYFMDGWYYYDVTYTAAGEQTHRIHCGPDAIHYVLDPDESGSLPFRTAKELEMLTSYRQARGEGEHRSYTPAEIENGLTLAAPPQ